MMTDERARGVDGGGGGCRDAGGARGGGGARERREREDVGVERDHRCARGMFVD